MPRGISRHRAAEPQTSLVLDARTMSALSADVDDYDLSTGACFSIGGSGADRTIKGIAGGTEGRFIELVNVLGYNIFLQHEATSSIAGNRILTGQPSNASYQIPVNGAVLLSYNNTVNRWVVMHGAISYTPETDANVAALFRHGPLIRAGGMLSQGFGSLKTAFTAKVSGDTTNQAFGAVAGAQVSFSMPKAGNAIIAVSGSIYSSIPNVAGTPSASLGARFDADTALALSSLSEANSGGSDYVNSSPMFGIWGKSLAAGAHTADLCWGESSGNYGLYSNAALPAVIIVFYPG